MSQESTLASELASAIGDSDARRLADATSAIDRFVFDLGHFPQDLFGAVIAALRSPALQELADSVALVKMFEFGLDLLSPPQREDLAGALLDGAPKFADETAAFLAVELLVDLWTGERLLKALKAMEAGASKSTLLTISHALDWLAKRTQDPAIKAECVKALTRMSAHADKDVAAEARGALKRRGG